jgi:MFS family permease
MIKLLKSNHRERILTASEFIVLLIWTLLIARPFLNLNSGDIPYGPELMWAIESHNVWEWVKECGSCAFWNGNLEGGYPAFANPWGSYLHPIVVLTTLGWGVINGSKLALIGALFLAGFGQWVLGFILQTGRLARLWTAMLAVIAGQVTSRLDMGAFGVMLSTASFSLAAALFIKLLKENRLRASVMLGASLAILGVGGQGYIQFGTALVFGLALLAYLIVFWPANRARTLTLFILGIFLAILLASPFVVPFLHFMPNISKDLDLNFTQAQPLAFIPLNLVINDFDFYRSEALGKAAFPAHYVLYVGWIPVLLAFFGLTGKSVHERKKLVFVLVMMLLGAFWISSAEPLRLMTSVLPFKPITSIVGGFRYTAFISGLAISPLLGLTAIGADRLLKWDWPFLNLNIGPEKDSNTTVSISLKWLSLIIFAIGLRSAYEANRRYIYTIKIRPGVKAALNALKTPDTQWVNVPFGLSQWVVPALDHGLKIGRDFTRTWEWTGRFPPDPVLEASIYGRLPDRTFKEEVAGFAIHEGPPGSEYAFAVHQENQRTVCSAQSNAGHIDVWCSLPQSGSLIVKENSWNGWRVWVNGQRASLQDSPWLSVAVPPGEVIVAFRYQPWDVPLGLFLFCLGVGLSAWIWSRDRQ